MVVRDVTVDGVPSSRSRPAVLGSREHSGGHSRRWKSGPHPLGLLLASPLAPGASATLRLGFTTTVPLEPVDGTGPFVFMPDTGRWTLAHWF